MCRLNETDGRTYCTNYLTRAKGRATECDYYVRSKKLKCRGMCIYAGKLFITGVGRLCKCDEAKIGIGLDKI